MFELTVASFCCDKIPTFFLQFIQYFSDFHFFILPESEMKSNLPAAIIQKMRDSSFIPMHLCIFVRRSMWLGSFGFDLKGFLSEDPRPCPTTCRGKLIDLRE